MKIAIGTIKVPKVEGVKEAVSSCPYFEGEEIEYILQKVESGVSDMPLSKEETMIGAKNRATNMRDMGIKADYYVGLEGGTWDIMGTKYLGGVTCIVDKNGEYHYGISHSIEVPKLVAKKLYEEDMELGPVMSELSGITNIQSKNGAMGALSNDMLVRKTQFIMGFQMAISPFFNKYYKL
ncbi:DUF84 family protein [Candidatus Gracilibacteria bacterium]|nr:DUF84 family protein [Candidatus Gracilibacteria bacterium]